MTVTTQIEKRDVPQWVADRLTSKGGTNRFGGPNFRAIWGGNRYHTVGGIFTDVVTVKDEKGRDRASVTRVADVRQLLKYHPHRWHLERWRGPEVYGDRESWYRDSWDEEAGVHTMGDYPSEGDYEHVFYLAECPHVAQNNGEWCRICTVGLGQYIPLEPNVYLLERQIWALQQSEFVSKDVERVTLFLREDKKRKLQNSLATMRVQNALRPRLALQPTSWQPGTGGKCSVPEANLTKFLPKTHTGIRQSDHALPAKKQEDMDNEN